MRTPSPRAVWALAIVACALLGCPTNPPHLRGTTLELGDTTGGASSSSSDDDDDAGGSDTAMSSEGSSSGEGTDEAGIDMDGQALEPSCWSSPADCTMPSEHTGPGECDPYAQDCPPNEKCMPIATDGQWTSTACRPVASTPTALGEPCTIEGTSGSGFDDCDVGLVCRSADGSTSGRCRELCGCGPTQPTCDGPATTCVQSGDIFGLCLPSCDPLAQDCVAPEGCYFTGEVGFVCTTSAAPQPTIAGDSCEAANACSPGQICVSARALAGCAGRVGCCADLCGVDGEPACSSGEQQCASIWGADTPPADCPADVGVCVQPAR